MLQFTSRSVSSFLYRIKIINIFTLSGLVLSFLPGLMSYSPSIWPIILTSCLSAGRSSILRMLSFVALASIEAFSSARSKKCLEVASWSCQETCYSTSSNTSVIYRFELTKTSWLSGRGTRSLDEMLLTQCLNKSKEARH